MSLGDVVVPPDDVAKINATISAAIMDCLLERCSHSVS